MPTLKDKIERLLRAECSTPGDVLGPHITKSGVTVRAFFPGKSSAWVVKNGKRHRMKQLQPEGFFEAVFPEKELFPYMLETEGEERFHDPYAFPPLLSDYDLHLIGEGTHYKKYEKLGAHIRDVRGVRGVHFAVWAPNAKRVSVVGDFNQWDGRRHQMNVRGASGVWELFVPGLGEGAVYKFELWRPGFLALKTDPYGFYSELRPMTASIAWNIDKYKWQDDEWMRARASKDRLDAPISQGLVAPMAIYEVHLGSWMRVPEEENRFLTYRELAYMLVRYVKEMGFTHIELLPLTEHPLDESWGYQTIGYFAPTSRHGTPEDLMYFVDCCHQNGIGVLMDWAPAHFPKDAHGLAFFDGTFLYEHEDPRKREHLDWGTHIFNYGRNEVSNFLLTSALFWLEKYHMDGLRVDAVASMLYLDYSRGPGEWIPNIYGGNENIEAISFLRRFNELCHQYHPGVLTVAEESTAWPMVSRPTYVGGLGFSLKWNMGWMHDMLLYFSKEPVYRKYHQNNITFGLLYAFHENFVLVLTHDEVVHGKRALFDKMPGDLWQRFANMRLLLGCMYAHPGKKMLFMGGEFGQWREWNSAESLDWNLLAYEPHRRLQRYVVDLNGLLRSEPSLHELDFEWEGFQWIDFSDSDSCVVSFIRKAKDPEDFLVFVFNFTPVPRHDYRVGVPKKAVYKELLNSDSETYWGSDTGNGGWVAAEDAPYSGQPYSLSLTLPPLGMLALSPLRA